MERFNIYHRRDGRWEGRVSDGKKSDGKRKFKYIFGKTKEAVREKISDIRKKVTPHDPCTLNVNQLFDEWHQSIRHTVKESTAANYLSKANKHILPEFGEKPADSIQKNEVYAFIELKQKAGLSNRYISDMLIVMKSMFKYAVRTHNILNPMDGIEMPRCTAPEIALLNEEEQDKLQNYIHNNQNKATLGVALSMTTGIRVGELCALQWKDIDLEKRIMTVTKTMQRVQVQDALHKTNPP